ncbi:COF family HAD hydrolase [Mycoplasmopsis californica]|uniref:COF family HAD hydrolase n=1 Tax=Mycoplasmopsis californica TaxID=2113 RepID=A0A059XL42_9BACT|nr:Cof-type HAD-IIB family hydrolase [Mycoplasmopsis californica]AIA29229.1 COF family HAD hydrolase [Mycoplasmopsis californica]
MNKNSIQAYFIDLDGTMLDKGDDFGYISEINRDYLLKMQAVKPVIISTGRKPEGAVQDLMKMIKAPYAVCSTGSLIVNNKGEIIHKVDIENETKNAIVQYFMSKKLYFMANGSGIIYYGAEFNWNKRDWVNRFKKQNYDTFNFEEDIRQFLVFGPEIDGIKEIEEYIHTNFPDLRTHIVSHGYSIEVTHKNASKGIANAFVANLLGVDIKKSAHIGDSKNDLNALPQVGYLVAMGNAHPDVKKASVYVGADYLNGGLAKTICGFEELMSKK